MHRLAVYGWDDEGPRLLEALQSAATFTVAAIGDRRASALVRARAAIGSPCYQHPLEMFRNATYDAALLATTNGAAQAQPSPPRIPALPSSWSANAPTAAR